MDEDIAIIDKNTRKEKIIIFFKEKKKLLLSIISTIVILLIIFFSYSEYIKQKRTKISDEYNSLIIEYSETNKEFTKKA